MGSVQLWESLKESIVIYTGLTPTTFFTVLAILLALYYIFSALFGSSSSDRNHHFQEEDLPPLKPPVQLGEITEEELKAYDGSDHDKPLLMAIKAQIYDVSQSRFHFIHFFFFSFSDAFLCSWWLLFNFEFLLLFIS